MPAGKIIKVMLCGVMLLLAACGGPLYKVAPLPTNPAPELTVNATAGLQLAAAAMNGDRALEQFDANLPLAGVIAVEVRLVNQTAAEIKTSKLKFALRDATNDKRKRLKLAKPKRALQRVMRYYGNRFYVIEGYRQTRAGYDELALPLNESLAPGEERSGFLFFETRRGPASLQGLTLSVSGAGLNINLPLPAQPTKAGEL